MTLLLAHWLRALIRLLMTRRVRVHPIEKLIRGMLLVPVFGSLLVLLRMRARVWGPLRLQAVTAEGFDVECHLPDLIQLYLFLFGVWEPDIASCIRARLAPGDVFVDVGANIGFDTLVAGRAVGGDGGVVAVEASPSVFRRLLQTLRINGHPQNVRTINQAAAATRGTLEIFSGPEHNVGLTTTVRRGDMRTEAQIPAAPLDQLLSEQELRRTRLVKIDVEGGEDAVLQGASGLVEHGRSDLEFLIELSPAWWSDKSKRPIDVLKPFLDAGFNVYELPNNYWPWRYLWPNEVARPRRSRRDLAVRIPRMDILLSRIDAAEL